MRVSKITAIFVIFFIASCVSQSDTADEPIEDTVNREYSNDKGVKGVNASQDASSDESVVVAEEPVVDSVLEAYSEGNAGSTAVADGIVEDAALADLLETKDAAPAAVAEQPVNAAPDQPQNAALPAAVIPGPSKPASARLMTSLLHWIGYNYSAKDGLLTIDLRTKGSPHYSVFQEINRGNQPELIVRLFGTSVRRPIRRPVDASEFRSPVSFIRTRTNSKNGSVDVILTLRDAVQPKLMVGEGGLTLTYRIPEHWFGIQNKLKLAKSQPAEVAEPLAKSNLYPVFEPQSRMPDVIDAAGSDESVPAAIPPQGAILHDAGGAWLVGQDNGFGLDEIIGEGADAAVTKPANTTQVEAPAAGSNAVDPLPAKSNGVASRAQNNATGNQANIAAMAASPGADLLGQDQAGRINGGRVRKINLDFRGAPLSEVIKAITDKSGVNFIYAGVIASIPVSIQLNEIPWDVAFKSILDLNALGLIRVANNLYRVDQLANIARERELIETAKIASQRLEPTRIMFLRLSYAQASEALGLVSEMLSNARARDPRIQIRAEQRTNSLIVEAPTRELARVKTLVERIDLQTPQVKIESRVVEVVKASGKSFGISWGAPFNFDQSHGLGFGTLPFPNFMRSTFAVDAGGGGAGVGSMNFLLGSINNSFNLDLKLRMAESEGLTETLQTNSVIVQNNQSASISGGQSDVFVLGSSAPGTAPQVLSVDYSMSVSVTPTVTADGSVRMTVTISSSSPSASIAAGATSGRYSRNINTVLLRRSGETAVIGGLNNRERSTGWSGIPILSRLPIIGALFRNLDKKQSNRELLLMVTPTIMNVAQSSGEGGSGTFDDSPGTASSASPDKLETTGADSEFRSEDLDEASSNRGNVANLGPRKKPEDGNAEANSSGNNNGSENALDAAVNEIKSEGAGQGGTVTNSANDAVGNGNNGAGGNDAG